MVNKLEEQFFFVGFFLNESLRHVLAYLMLWCLREINLLLSIFSVRKIYSSSYLGYGDIQVLIFSLVI